MLPENILNAVQTAVKNTAFASTEILGMAQKEGLFVNSRSFAVKDTKYSFSNNNYDKISWEAYENANEEGFGLTAIDTNMMGFFSKLRLSPAQMSGVGASDVALTVQSIVASQMRGKMLTIESALACGEAGRYVDSPKATTASLKAKGILFDDLVGTIAGGTGADNNVANYGDFYDTFTLAEVTAKPYGLDTENAYVLMDTATYKKMRNNKSTNVWESNDIKAGFPNWKIAATDTPLGYGLTSNHYIWFLFPKDTAGVPTIEFPIAVPMGAEAIGGGSLQGSGFYEWFVGMKVGARLVTTDAVIKTGALTIA